MCLWTHNVLSSISIICTYISINIVSVFRYRHVLCVLTKESISENQASIQYQLRKFNIIFLIFYKFECVTMDIWDWMCICVCLSWEKAFFVTLWCGDQGRIAPSSHKNFWRHLKGSLFQIKELFISSNKMQSIAILHEQKLSACAYFVRKAI